MFDHEHPAAPPTGWQSWMKDSISGAHIVVVYLDKKYRIEARRGGGKGPGAGVGVEWQAIGGALHGGGLDYSRLLIVTPEEAPIMEAPAPAADDGTVFMIPGQEENFRRALLKALGINTMEGCSGDRYAHLRKEWQRELDRSERKSEEARLASAILDVAEQRRWPCRYEHEKRYWCFAPLRWAESAEVPHTWLAWDSAQDTARRLVIAAQLTPEERSLLKMEAGRSIVPRVRESQLTHGVAASQLPSDGPLDYLVGIPAEGQRARATEQVWSMLVAHDRRFDPAGRWSLICELFASFCECLKDLHKQHRAVRCIDPSNVLLDETPTGEKELRLLSLRGRPATSDVRHDVACDVRDVIHTLATVFEEGLTTDTFIRRDGYGNVAALLEAVTDNSRRISALALGRMLHHASPATGALGSSRILEPGKMVSVRSQSPPPAKTNHGAVALPPHAPVWTSGSEVPRDDSVAPPARSGAATRETGREPVNGANHYRPETVPLTPGTFYMGSPPEEPGRSPDERLHLVRLTVPFQMAVSPVTQDQYIEVIGHNPAHFHGSDRGTHPVEQVTWLEAVHFCNALSELEGRQAVYQIDGSRVSWDSSGGASGYRLPTEAEWEYAVRADTRSPFFAGVVRYFGTHNAPALDPFAWYAGNSGLRGGKDSSGWPQMQRPAPQSGTQPVMSKRPNPWHLHDMLGNVLEWCWDRHSGDYGGVASLDKCEVDPRGPATGSYRVCRGGSWIHEPTRLRAASRFPLDPEGSSAYVGFRVLRSTA